MKLLSLCSCLVQLLSGRERTKQPPSVIQVTTATSRTYTIFAKKQSVAQTTAVLLPFVKFNKLENADLISSCFAGVKEEEDPGALDSVSLRLPAKKVSLLPDGGFLSQIMCLDEQVVEVTGSVPRALQIDLEDALRQLESNDEQRDTIIDQTTIKDVLVYTAMFSKKPQRELLAVIVSFPYFQLDSAAHIIPPSLWMARLLFGGEKGPPETWPSDTYAKMELPCAQVIQPTKELSESQKVEAIKSFKIARLLQDNATIQQLLEALDFAIANGNQRANILKNYVLEEITNRNYDRNQLMSDTIWQSIPDETN